MGEWAADAHSQATEARDEIGVLSNFFRKLNVAEFTLRKHDLKTGASLLIEGPTTGAVRFAVENLHVNGKPVASANPGEVVTLALPAKARRQDKVFLLTPRN